MTKDLAIISTATAAGGVPDDIQRGIVQVVVALVTWGLTKLLDRLNRKKPKVQ